MNKYQKLHRLPEMQVKCCGAKYKPGAKRARHLPHCQKDKPYVPPNQLRLF